MQNFPNPLRLFNPLISQFFSLNQHSSALSLLASPDNQLPQYCRSHSVNTSQCYQRFVIILRFIKRKSIRLSQLRFQFSSFVTDRQVLAAWIISGFSLIRKRVTRELLACFFRDKKYFLEILIRPTTCTHSTLERGKKVKSIGVN